MSKKQKIHFVCSSCGYESPAWSGKCHSCGEWGSLKEFKEASVRPGLQRTTSGSVPLTFSNIKASGLVRTVSGINEFDRVLGGGSMPGMTVLIGGDPGIGKSTLMLKYCSMMSKTGLNTLYVSGEESSGQIKQRAERTDSLSDSMKIFCENDLPSICAAVEKEHFDLIVLDSVQTVFDPSAEAAPGSPGQIKNTASVMIMLAKKMSFRLFLIGHVTKDGAIAGPKMIEHMVDTVLYFEGDSYHRFRILRTVKNRFGPSGETGIFEMENSGLVEVKDPSMYFINTKELSEPGTSVSVTMEGTRPMLLEIQALTAPPAFGTPQRNCVGYDIKKLGKIIAVLDRILGFKISSGDVFLNVTGGVRIDDPAADMSVAVSLISSVSSKPLPAGSVFCGEIGLNGEIRAVSGIGARVKECVKLGFDKIYVPEANLKDGNFPQSKKIVPVSKLTGLISVISVIQS